MIYGIGTDICAIGRIEAALHRQGERFAQKILTPTEQALWQAHAQRSAARATRYLATRFSAKEAFAKAIGLGMVQPMSWQCCEISTAPSGQPCIVLHGALLVWFEQRHLHAHLSLSDEKNYAVGFCLVEIRKNPEKPMAPIAPMAPL